MNTNSSSTILVIGLAAFGLAMAVAGVELYRRHRARHAASSPQDDLPVETGTGNEVQGQGAEIPDDRDSHRNVPSNASQKKLPLDYFGLVFALTIPFWLFGGHKLPIPLKLPVSALALINPLLAALILTYRRDGLTGTKELFKKVLDYQKIKNKTWYLPTLFFRPLIMVLSYIVMRLAGVPLPDPQIPWLMAPVLFLVFFIAAIGEELGWTGYAIDPMQNRWGALKASIVLGLVWALIHIIPDLQNGQTANWILWHRLGTVALRILMVWIYNNTGKSVFSAILFHAMDNLSWALFPNYGSHYDPFITSMITFLAAGIVIFGWGSKTLARYRFARLSLIEVKR
jgi:membrane protease YdiL (CAAX protease family)